MALAVAARYARALADLALAPASGLEPQAVVRQMKAFEEELAHLADLRNMLLSPAVQPPRKRAVVKRISEMLGVSRLVTNFLCLVIDRRRIAILPEIREAFQAILDERLGLAAAEVVSALELTGEQRDAIAAQLARMTGKDVRCSFSVDGALLGGAVARVGSTVYDGSVRGQLEGLRRRLVE